VPVEPKKEPTLEPPTFGQAIFRNFRMFPWSLTKLYKIDKYKESACDKIV